MFGDASGSMLTTGAAARRARSRQEMHDAILETARQIVDQKGVGKLTIRGIAQALGYSVGAIYEYFNSKESILEALYFLGTGGLGDQMAITLKALPEGTSTIDRLLALADTYRDYAHDHVELYWLSFSGMKHRPETVETDPAGQHQVGFGPVLDVVQQGIADGTFISTINPMAIAIAAWSAVHGFVSLELSGHMKDGDIGEEAVCHNGIQRRDDFFHTLTSMVIYGFVRRD